MGNDFADSEKGNSLGIAESRAHSRASMRSLAYIELSESNGGLILNISEDGLAVQAVQVVSPEQLSHMKFRLPKTSIPIEVTGRLVWQLRSKKEAGIQFVNLSDEARQGIRKWITSEESAPAAEAEVVLPTFPQIQKPAPTAQTEFGPAAEGVKQPAPAPAPKVQVPAAQAPKVKVPAAEAPKPQVPAAQAPKVPAEAPKQQPVRPPSTPPMTVAAAIPPKAKPKESRLPISEPTIAPPQIPMPPSPAPPAIAAQQNASAILVQQPVVLPASGPAPASVEAPPLVGAGQPPSVGSAFPAGRLPLRPAAQPPLPGAVANMPSWNGYVAPGVGMRYRRPRGWWTYTAALGIIAAVGFAGLMMIDPSTISRARLSTAVHQPDATANVPQAFATNNGSNPSTPATNSTQVPIPGGNPAANGSSGVNSGTQPPQQTPPNQNAQTSSPAQTNPASDNAAPTTRAVPVNPFDASGSASGAATNPAANGKPAEANTSSEGKHAKRDEPARQSAHEESAKQPAKNNAARTEIAQPSKEPPTSQGQARAGASEAGNTANSSAGNVQGQPNSPAASTPSVPASAPPTQPTATKGDQDDYAHTARREGVPGAGSVNPTSAQEKAHTTAPAESSRPSVEVSGERSSPVAPSVPLIGVPSGSVGANSLFRSFRVPPELQSKASQLAGSLQIGQMLSSYAPSYPQDAARAGVEGIVKLDVMVAPNGNVESVKIISGPPMLTAVSVSAVKGWHYGETLLGGQPVEAEQYVTLIFRLAK